MTECEAFEKWYQEQPGGTLGGAVGLWKAWQAALASREPVSLENILPNGGSGSNQASYMQGCIDTFEKVKRRLDAAGIKYE